MFVTKILATLTLVSVYAVGVYSHGYMSKPFCRGCEKATYLVDDVKNPNTKGICRGEPAGQVTEIQGNSVTLGFTITAPHVGGCKVFLLDEDLGNSIQIGERNNCAAPGMVGDWTVTLPRGTSGRKVIRWTWDACHISPCEKYEQCADINVTP
jgi:predicted carbohydrate-binding protein with CBM5 and CBM33 domain